MQQDLQIPSSVERADKQALLQDQFRLPQGLVGRLVGWFMTRSNERLNRAALALLDVQPGEAVLEIGFGPGQAIELLVARSAAGRIAGVDPSEVMVDQARERNREAIEAGRVTLVQGTVSGLPFPERHFGKVFAVSNFGIWDSIGDGLQEIRRVLVDRGRLVVCLRREAKRPRPWTSPGLTAREFAENCERLREHGFQRVRLVRPGIGRRTMCIVAEK